jgi:amino acid permease
MTKFEKWIIAFALICALIYGILDAMQDTLAHHYTGSVFTTLDQRYWNPNVSYCNKWDNCRSGDEAFPLSSTALVWLTDGWHYLKFLKNRILWIFPAMFIGSLYTANDKAMALFFKHTLIAYLILALIQGAAFNLFYNYLLLL